MAENGLFRSSMRGFNRQDVLNYIDSLQSEQEKKLAELQSQLDAARAQANASQAHAEAMQAERDEAVQKAAELTEQNDQLEELINEHNRINRELRAKLEEQNAQQAGQSKLELDNARLRAVNAMLREQQAKYQAIAGNLEKVAAQMRKYSLGFLGASCKRSEECLDGMEQMVAAYENELAETRRRIGEARETLEEQKNAAGLHLDEMLRDIMGGKAPAAANAEKPAPAAPATPAQTEHKPRLLRERPANNSRPGSWLANWLK